MVPVPAGFDRSSSGSGRIQNSGSGRSLIQTAQCYTEGPKFYTILCMYCSCL